MPGGTFWQVGVDLMIPSSKPSACWGLTVSYQRYGANAGVADELRIGLTGWLQ